MIIIMNIILAVIGVLGLFAANRITISCDGLIIKNHFIILGMKIFSISTIIYIFSLNSEKNIQTILILTGLFNLIMFHFIEAFVTQRRLINIRKFNA